jgi:hypothetical protein
MLRIQSANLHTLEDGQDIKGHDMTEANLTTTQPETTPFHLIQMAIDKDLNVDKLERLLDLQKSYQADIALKAYADAMNICQQEMPVVVRDKKNESTGSLFARLETVATAIRPVYTKNGFSLDFTEEDSPLEGHRRVSCEVMHVGGHSKKFHLDSKIDDVGVKGTANKTAIQGLGSMVSYLRRYLTLMIFNVTVADEDNDGNSSEPTMSEEQLIILRTKFNDHFSLGIGNYPSVNDLEAKFVTWIAAQQRQPDLTRLEDAHSALFPRAIALLDGKLRSHQVKQA